LHRLSTSFVLGYHGCEREVGERLLSGDAFKASNNDYDWLGPGIYFWEANPLRGLEFAHEAARRHGSTAEGCVLGAVIDLGNCLDLTTSDGIRFVRDTYEEYLAAAQSSVWTVPQNSRDGLLRRLDCAVLTRLHEKLRATRSEPIDTIKAVFVEGSPIYPTAGFYEKTHTQIAVCNPECIRGVFRVSKHHLR
jgi:hypothetical protein